MSTACQFALFLAMGMLAWQLSRLIAWLIAGEIRDWKDKP